MIRERERERERESQEKAKKIDRHKLKVISDVFEKKREREISKK